jgi:hypothetical protein
LALTNWPSESMEPLTIMTLIMRHSLTATSQRLWFSGIIYLEHTSQSIRRESSPGCDRKKETSNNYRYYIIYNSYRLRDNCQTVW